MYQLYRVFGFYAISRCIPPKAKSIFFSDQFSIHFISSNFFGFFPCQPLLPLAFPPEKLGKLSKSFVCSTKVDLPFNNSKNKISPQQKESKEC